MINIWKFYRLYNNNKYLSLAVIMEIVKVRLGYIVLRLHRVGH